MGMILMINVIKTNVCLGLMNILIKWWRLDVSASNLYVLVFVFLLTLGCSHSGASWYPVAGWLVDSEVELPPLH